jgi:phosphate transport system permease protein
MASSARAEPTRTRSVHGGRGSTPDRLFERTTWVIALGAIVTLFAIILLLLFDSREALFRYGVGFFFGTTWDPVFEEFGAAAFIYGTLVTSLIGLLLAAPVGVGAALYLVEYAPGWVRGPVSFLVEMLAAIPSIIYGLWAFFVLAPWMRSTVEPALRDTLGPVPVVGALFQGTPIGKDLLTAGVILAIMILPTLMAVSREVITTVPDTQREGMVALGATKWETIQKAVLPYARSGIIGAAMLALARALGETMAVTMVIGNSSTDIRASLFTPGYTMASVIANQFTEADTEIYFAAIVYVALALLVVSTIINIFARLLVWGLAKGPGDTRA